jgi:hypothetical protein
MIGRSEDERLRHIDQATFIFAKLSTHEFILEVLLANELAEYEETRAEDIAEAFKATARRACGLISADPDTIAQMRNSALAMQALVEQLVGKALRRSVDIRQGRG